MSSVNTTPAPLDAWNPATGACLGRHAAATVADARGAVDRAAAASASGQLADPAARAALLRGIARRLRARSGLLELCARETGLGPARLEGELARTAGQLEALAGVTERGEEVDAIVDRGGEGRPDLRRMLVPIGPVAVFGAGNFPLAFSTAGGDTAAALAAGCPVVCKGHPGHPGTSTAVAEEVAGAVADAGLPEGTFSHVLAADLEPAQAIVDHPALEAVAFTGSFAAGRAIVARAAARPRPIPVFAEMGSVNPVVITEAALEARGAEIAAGLAASVCGSGGQLCTKPGVVLVPAGERGRALCEDVAARLAATDPGPLLSRGQVTALRAAIPSLPGAERLTPAADGDGAGDAAAFRFAPVALAVSAASLAAEPTLLEERFGPVVLLASYASAAELDAALGALPGQLTCSLHAQPDAEPEAAAALAARLSSICGRLVFDGFPTGVAVNWAMVHGGPWPATSAPQHTSVGMTAVRRFLRPVAWQDAPDALLPPELRDANPRGIWRRVDGELTRAAAGG